MKLVRENINEKFTEDSDPVADMEIGSKYLIHKWCESAGIDQSRYTIDDNLNIEVKGNLDLQETNVTKLPDNLSVGGFLDLSGTRIKELPDNLSVGGWLYLGNKITELPDNLRVGGNLYIGSNISEFPESLKVKGYIIR
jgi:hypothetical protein